MTYLYDRATLCPEIKVLLKGRSANLQIGKYALNITHRPLRTVRGDDRKGGKVLCKSRSTNSEIGKYALNITHRPLRTVRGDDRKGGKVLCKSRSTNSQISKFALLLIFICCLFSYAALAQPHKDSVAVNGVVGESPDGHMVINISYKYLFNKKANDYNKAHHPNIELEKYPLIMYDMDYAQTPNIKIGDKLPAFFNTIAFQFVDGEGKSQTGTIADFSKDSLLILDFWATWCSPCVASMDKWNSYVKEETGGTVKVLGVMLDHDFRAQYYGVERDWSSPIIFGPEAYIMNSFFFDRQVVSRMVWIKGGRVIAITGTKGYDLEMVRDVIAGKEVDIPMAYEWTYSPSKP